MDDRDNQQDKRKESLEETQEFDNNLIQEQEQEQEQEPIRVIESQQKETVVIASAPAAKVKIKKQTTKKKKVVAVVTVLLVVAIAAATVWWIWLRDTSSVNPSNPDQKNNTSTNKAEKEMSPELKRFINPTTGETWYANPKKLSKQGFYSQPDGGSTTQVDEETGEEYDTENAEITYYELGKRADNTIILAHIDEMFGMYELFEKTSEGKVSVIAHPTHDVPKEFQYPEAATYAKNITIDKKTRYDSLSVPSTITLDDGIVLKRPDYVTIGSLIGAKPTEAGETREKVQTIGASKIYRMESSFADTKLSDIGYAIETPAHMTFDLIYEPLPLAKNDLGWLGSPKAGEGSEEYIKPIARGCGFGERITRSDSIKAADLQLFKTSPEGKKVYVIKDSNNSLWVKAYEEFKDFVKYDTENKNAKMTKAQFVAANAVMVYQDSENEYFVYVRTDLAPAAGCAKPVVYLYPTKTTRVNVRIGADVKISEPLYDAKTGWNATARPDGQLTVNGTLYDSLFWEGPGYGKYPAIVTGTVVRQSDAIATIRSQLAKQGFNQKEINDFVEYWHDKLPNKPYIRLSWLTTEQMNRLAPLQISPKPDTVIRTFLDFSGHDQKIDIAPQTFTTPERRGFTVTEWGGLSPFKLY